MQESELRDNTYKKCFDIFGRKIVNTAFYKEMSQLEKVYPIEKIHSYLCGKEDYLSGAMEKNYVSEYAQIRYFSAILKNSLTDYVMTEPQNEKKIEVIIPEMKYKKKAGRKAMDDIEAGGGE